MRGSVQTLLLPLLLVAAGALAIAAIAMRDRSPSDPPSDGVPSAKARAASPGEGEGDIDPALLADLLDPAVDPRPLPAPDASGPRPPGGGPPGGTAGASRGGSSQNAPLRATARAVLGDARRAARADRVGAIDLARCFAEIPEYREIRERGLSRTKARYHFLLREANLKLLDAVTRVAGERGIEIVLQEGGFEGGRDGQVTDLTAEVIEVLKAA